MCVRIVTVYYQYLVDVIVKTNQEATRNSGFLLQFQNNTVEGEMLSNKDNIKFPVYQGTTYTITTDWEIYRDIEAESIEDAIEKFCQKYDCERSDILWVDIVATYKMI